MELKTLKEIGNFSITHISLREDLKYEAIKWVKERITKCKRCSCLGSWSQLICCKEHRFWMERFNITEEDFESQKGE